VGELTALPSSIFREEREREGKDGEKGGEGEKREWSPITFVEHLKPVV